jgi:hypothetical protein
MDVPIKNGFTLKTKLRIKFENQAICILPTYLFTLLFKLKFLIHFFEILTLSHMTIGAHGTIVDHPVWMNEI